MAERRLEACRQNLKLFNDFGDDLLRSLITEDETPLSLFVPFSRRDSKEWKKPEERASLMNRCGSSHGRELMLSIFWNRKGCVLMDFLEKGHTITANHYQDLIKK